MKKDLLEGKRVLIVDDEPDVLDTLAELLPMCQVEKAYTFDGGRELLETGKFDVAILDIMGVDGYKLLEIANRIGVIAVMLTAHALSVQDTKRSYKEGAASYIPKDEMGKITIFLNDILEAQKRGKSFWWRWFYRLGPYYDQRFGTDWEKEDKEFWEKFRYYAGKE
jgi:DNA-binding NtrC family response regulator